MWNIQQMAALESFDVETYFRALVAVAAADGTICDDELGFMKDQATLLEFDLNPLMESTTSIEDFNLSTVSEFTKKLIIRDCIALAHADGNYDAEEKKEVAAIADKIGVPANQVADIEQWLTEYWAVLEKGERLFTA